MHVGDQDMLPSHDPLDFPHTLSLKLCLRHDAKGGICRIRNMKGEPIDKATPDRLVEPLQINEILLNLRVVSS
jgi:hypothetical protein